MGQKGGGGGGRRGRGSLRNRKTTMTASRRVLNKKNAVYADNINKRGEVPPSLVVDTEKRANALGISPFAVGMLIFVVIGSSCPFWAAVTRARSLRRASMPGRSSRRDSIHL